MTIVSIKQEKLAFGVGHRPTSSSLIWQAGWVGQGWAAHTAERTLLYARNEIPQRDETNKRRIASSLVGAFASTTKHESRVNAIDQF